jgi:hypothetical protein
VSEKKTETWESAIRKNILPEQELMRATQIIDRASEILRALNMTLDGQFWPIEVNRDFATVRDWCSAKADGPYGDQVVRMVKAAKDLRVPDVTALHPYLVQTRELLRSIFAGPIGPLVPEHLRG